MAKIYLDRLKKKYGKDITSKSYSEIISLIIDQNSTNIQNKVMRITSKNWQEVMTKITPKEKKFVLPDIRDVLPARAISIRKAAEKGKLISDTLRDKLTKQLRSTMLDFETKTGLPSYVRRRGTTAGRINPNLVKDFEQNISNTFKNYVRRDKALKMPTNIHNIAVTEMRSSINEIKQKYTSRLLEKNPNIQVNKKWIQNKSLSENPRKGHSKIDGKIIPFNELFKVPRYKKIKGRDVLIGYTFMQHPHDPSAPPDQIIGCNCDIDQIISRKRTI